MSFNNSDKEFYYSLYLKFNKEKIEEILNIEIGNDIELDKNFKGRKIDFYSVLKDSRELFMELQLSQGNNIHLQQLIKLIKQQELNNYLLVWVATGFKADMLYEVEKEINLSCKNIYFVALSLNEKLIDYLNILNNIYVNKVIGNLKILNDVKNHFIVKEIFYRLQDENNIRCNERKEEILDLSKKQDVMKYLLIELRRQISYYPSIHRDKKLDGFVIVLGAGKADINYYIGLNRRNQLYVEIKFGEKQKDIFKTLLEKEEEICDELDYLAEFDAENRKIGTYLYYKNDKRKMLIKQVARIVDKYIKYFSPYLFPNSIEENA